MSKLTKNQKIAYAKVEPGKAYKLAEAAALLKEITFTKFDASVDIDVRLGVDPRKANQMVRGVVTLPHGTGKEVRVLVLCTPDKETEAKEAGADFVLPDGTVVPNDRLTRPAAPPVRYAYCSDTAYNEKLIPLVEGVDLLYHEATFGDEAVAMARRTFHSTARQAATLARNAQVKKLMIGHFSARYNDEETLLAEAREEFPETILAREGLKYSF